jgi:hypothetical protein
MLSLAGRQLRCRNFLVRRNFSIGYSPSAGDIDALMENVGATSTPFVNRLREIRDIAVCNAEFVSLYRRHEESGEVIRDFRGHEFVFAAQMFGASKTRLGLMHLRCRGCFWDSSWFGYEKLVSGGTLGVFEILVKYSFDVLMIILMFLWGAGLWLLRHLFTLLIITNCFLS